jgi:hypothetical protein
MARPLFRLLVLLLPVVQPLHAVVGGMVVPPVDFLFPLLAVAWLRERPAWRRSALAWPLAAYAAALALSAAASADPGRSAIKLGGELYLMGLGVLAFQLTRTADDLRAVSRAWTAGVLLTVVVVVAGLAAWALGWRSPHENLAIAIPGSLPPGPYPRLQALFHYPNMLCNYLNASLGPMLPLAPPLLVGALLVLAVFTWSPGLAGLTLTLALWRRRGIPVAIVLAVGFLGAATVSPAGLLRGALEPSSRVLAWRDAVRSLLDEPWTGRGLGLGASDVRYLDAAGVVEHLTDAHDVWLNVAGEAGLPAVVALAWLTVALLRGPWRSAEHRALALAVVGAWLYQGVTGSVEDTRHVWVLFGLLAAAREGLDDVASPRPGRP